MACLQVSFIEPKLWTQSRLKSCLASWSSQLEYTPWPDDCLPACIMLLQALYQRSCSLSLQHIPLLEKMTRERCSIPRCIPTLRNISECNLTSVHVRKSGVIKNLNVRSVRLLHHDLVLRNFLFADVVYLRRLSCDLNALLWLFRYCLDTSMSRTKLLCNLNLVQ